MRCRNRWGGDSKRYTLGILRSNGPKVVGFMRHSMVTATDNELVSSFTLDNLIGIAAGILLLNTSRQVMLPWLSVSIYRHSLTPAESSEDLKSAQRAVLARCCGL